MPEAVVTPKEGDLSTQEGLAQHNAEIIQANQNQDINVQPIIGDLNAPSGDALDALRDKLAAEKQATSDANDPAKKAAAEEAARQAAEKEKTEKEKTALQQQAASGDADAATRLQAQADEEAKKVAEQKARDDEQARLQEQADKLFKDAPATPRSPNWISKSKSFRKRPASQFRMKSLASSKNIAIFGPRWT
jgi:membrane protein involved in colicin uptake